MNLANPGTYKHVAGRKVGPAILTLLAVFAFSAAAQNVAAQAAAFQLDPAQTSVKFTLGDVLHTVQGTFQLKHGSVESRSGLGKNQR